jgi:cytochrome c peroxidase
VRSSVAITALALTATVAACDRGDDGEDELREYFDSVQQDLVFSLGSNRHADGLHLERNLRFPQIRAGADADRGRQLFGLAADLDTPDDTLAIFEGYSQAYGAEYPIGGVVTSNGRTCFSCHRGISNNFGLPKPPLTDTIPLTDPLFTGIEADAQGDPDSFDNLNDHGLIKYRPNRFNLARPQSDPFRQVFFWRKSPFLVNVRFQRGFLLDGRGRLLFEAARGAVFSHTQETDGRFDDLLSPQDNADWEAFLFGQVSDPALEALFDPDHPNHDHLRTHPFATVPVSTWAQRRGKWVFIRDCMSCHNTPNVFNNIENIQAGGLDPERPPEFPTHGPNVGKGFNVGVSELNKHGLRFTVDDGSGNYVPVVLELANEDGTVNNHTVTFDVGMAATTARTADVGKFKVPQLRKIAELGPYFHDNSAETLWEVIEYFNSAHYNNSKDGRRHPIHETWREKHDLLEFLKIL